MLVLTCLLSLCLVCDGHVSGIASIMSRYDPCGDCQLARLCSCLMKMNRLNYYLSEIQFVYLCQKTEPQQQKQEEQPPVQKKAIPNMFQNERKPGSGKSDGKSAGSVSFLQTIGLELCLYFSTLS